MSKFFEYDIDDCVVYNLSDWHIGSKAFHEKSAKEIMQTIIEEDAYVTFGGDQIEGKLTKSNHFDPKSLVGGLETIDDQADYFCELVQPIAERILCMTVGNHELYLLPDLDITKSICSRLGIKDVAGDYQNWVKLNDVTLHLWHGRPSMPKGAKDRIQREANQKAWLKRKFEELAGSAHAHYMAHTHQCLVVEPQSISTLLNSGENVKRHTFIPPSCQVDGMEYVPVEARWFANTGTLRRGGGFNHMDYSEIAGYNPPEIACTRTEIKDGRIKEIRKVLL